MLQVLVILSVVWVAVLVFGTGRLPRLDRILLAPRESLGGRYRG